MKKYPIQLLSSALLFALSLTCASTFAQPPENRGNAEAREGKHNQKFDEKRHGYKSDDGRYSQEERSRDQDERSVNFEEAIIRAIFRDQQRYIEPTASLPPGIRKNLARGKPLPPGIAKRFDGRVRSSLPDYPGYDWRQVGTDAVLIDVTTGVIEAIIDNVLQ
jgi:Ni/Co efflux regulator RcnB